MGCLHRVQRLCCPGTRSQSLITAEAEDIAIATQHMALENVRDSEILGHIPQHIAPRSIHGQSTVLHILKPYSYATDWCRFRGAQRGAQKVPQVLIHLYCAGCKLTSRILRSLPTKRGMAAAYIKTTYLGEYNRW